jgi:hypothetical protein
MSERGRAEAFKDAMHSYLDAAKFEKARAERAERMVQALLNHCPDAECMECAKIVCPHGEPMHFHHDGCPACHKPK